MVCQATPAGSACGCPGCAFPRCVGALNAMMGQEPTVSVIIPCHDHARYLACRLNTIRAQTMASFEALFIDDGSTDHSYETALELAGADPRFTFLRADPPAGSPFPLWRMGLARSRAPFVWIAESDDASDPVFLEELLMALRAGPDIGLAYCQSFEIDADDRPLGSLVSHTDAIDPLRWRGDYIAAGARECREALLFRNTIPNVSACVFRVPALRAALPATEGFSLCGDWACHAALALAGWRIAFRSRALNHYRRHAGSMRETLARQGTEIAEATEVRRRIKAALPLSAGEIAQASVFALERLTDLAKNCDAAVASRWFAEGPLLAALTDFDPHFLAGLAGMAPNRRLWLDLFAASDGAFHEGCKCALPYAPNRPCTLAFLVPAGPLRIDPSRSPGLYRITDLRLSPEQGGDVLATEDGCRPLDALVPAGTCFTLSRDAAGILLYAYGDDPILLLPSLGNPGERLRVEIDIVGYSLVPGDMPLPAVF